MDLITSSPSEKQSAPHRPRASDAAADRAQLLLPVLAAVLTAAVAFWGMTVPQFWFDEAATISATNRPFGSLLRLLQDVDAVHGLYYVLMHPWVALFGTSELAMRTPSALALTLAAPLITQVAMIYAHRWLPDRVLLTGLSTSLIFAVLPGLSWAGQDARGYAMAVFASVAALRLFERFRDERSTGSLIGFALLQAAAIGFSMYAAGSVLLYLMRAAAWGRRPFQQVLSATAATTALVTPLGLLALSQRGQIGWIDMTTRQVVGRMLLRTFPLSPGNRGAPWDDIAVGLAPWLLGLIIVVLALGLIRSPLRRLLLWLLAFPLLPLSCVLVAQLLGKQLFQERYFTFSAPFLVLAVALSLASLRWRPAAVGLTAAVVGLSAPSIPAQNTWDAKGGDNYATASALVARSETVIFMDRSNRGVLLAYPPEHEIADPMLQEDRISADNLYGLNRPGYESWEIDTVGATSVVSNKENKFHDTVVSHLRDNGCQQTQEDRSTRFRITLLECPAPAAG